MIDIGAFHHPDWTKIWAGTWSFLSCSHFGVEYTKLVRFGSRPFITQTIIFVADGKSECWITQTDRDILGKFLAAEIHANPGRAIEICQRLKQEVDAVLQLMDSLSAKGIDLASYKKFWRQIDVYYQPHIYVKYVVDYLEPALLKELLPHLEDARVYAEPVFKRSEEFIIQLAEAVGKKIGLPASLALNFSASEMEAYLSSGVFPPRNILEERDKNSALLFDETGYQVIVGNEVEKVRKLVRPKTERNELRGMTAYAGKVRGRVRIILDPATIHDFQPGDILVAGMTRPEYLPLMKQAAAMVTDGGGILCHAAIVARELKKPCVIGTQHATQIFQDGDMVEVDAERGVVRKLG